MLIRIASRTMSAREEVERGALVGVPTLSTVASNPFVPPTGGRCPINELPTELLSYIFLLGTAGSEEGDDDDDDEEDIDGSSASSDDDDGDDDWERDQEFELLISHVCRHWRDVAVGTPALWTSIDFEDGPPYEKSRTYLERSKNAPLELSVDLTLDDDEAEDYPDLGAALDDLHQIMKLVVAHVSHWRSFELMVSNYRLMHLALTGLSSCAAAPMLEVLQLYHYEDTEEYGEFTPASLKEQNFILFNGNAPKLAHVALWGVHLDWANSHFLSGLCDLELAYHAQDVRPSYRDFVRILRDSPELITLTLCLSGPAGGPTDWLASMTDEREDGEEPHAPMTTLAIPSLKNLVLAYIEPEYVTQLIQRLALPNVTSLAIDFEYADSSDFLRSLARPAPTTGKPLLAGLQALKLSGLPCSKVAVAEAYAAMSNLTSLNLNFDYLDEAWHVLLAPRPEGVFLPRLEALSLTGLEGKKVRELVEARKLLGVPIRQVFMNEEDEIESDDEEWLKQNVDSFEYFEGSDDDEIMEVDMEAVGLEEGGEGDDQWEDAD